MTDLVQNLTSDRVWLRNEAQRYADSLPVDSYVDANSVLRWKSNDRVPFDDMLELAAHIGISFDLKGSQKARDKDTDAFLADYRKNYKGPSDEERFEARAAFGPGVTLVNVVTGHKWRT